MSEEAKRETTGDEARIARLAALNDRLIAAAAYCRPRLRRPEHQAELDRILAGDRDAQIANPDHTPMTGG